MSEALRQYYLQQIGIQTWVSRTSSAEKSDLQQLAAVVASCTRCPLHQTRTQTVFARGNPNARLMVVGEAPGYHEDKQGLPFVGKAGGLLNKMLNSIGFNAEDVYVANVLKCRPPENRDPVAEEIQQCAGYLAQQIALVQPALILAVGRFAAQNLLQQSLPLKVRSGCWILCLNPSLRKFKTLSNLKLWIASCRHWPLSLSAFFVPCVMQWKERR